MKLIRFGLTITLLSLNPAYGQDSTRSYYYGNISIGDLSKSECVIYVRDGGILKNVDLVGCRIEVLGKGVVIVENCIGCRWDDEPTKIMRRELAK